VRYDLAMPWMAKGILMISVLIGVLIIVVGAICFWAIDKFANDRRLEAIVVLICLGAILQRVLPLVGMY
jgi:hypothetical protein